MRSAVRTVSLPFSTAWRCAYRARISIQRRRDGACKATFRIAKAANGLATKANVVTLKASKLKKKKLVVSAKKAFVVSNANGKVTYRLSGVSKKKFKKYFSVNKKNGKVTVGKGLRKGAYRLKVAVSATGDANHEAVTKTVTTKVVVR